MTSNLAFPTKWFTDHNISSHSIAVALIAGATLYQTDTTVFNLVNSTLAAHPRVLAGITAVVGIILKYSGSHSTQGQLELIANTPPAQVAAASAATHITPPKVV